jgi:hypothetical protein
MFVGRERSSSLCKRLTNLCLFACQKGCQIAFRLRYDPRRQSAANKCYINTKTQTGKLRPTEVQQGRTLRTATRLHPGHLGGGRESVQFSSDLPGHIARACGRRLHRRKRQQCGPQCPRCNDDKRQKLCCVTTKMKAILLDTRTSHSRGSTRLISRIIKPDPASDLTFNVHHLAAVSKNVPGLLQYF